QATRTSASGAPFGTVTLRTGALADSEKTSSHMEGIGPAPAAADRGPREAGADRIERTGARQTQGLQGRVEARERNRAAARTRAPTVTGSRGLQTEPRNQWGGRGAKERRRFSAAAKNPKAISRAPRSIGASQATGSV